MREKSAYIHEDLGEDAYKHARKYYHVLQKVPHFGNLNDKIFKFSTSFSTDHVSELLRNLKKSIGSFVTPVSSGHGDIDLMIPGLHKSKRD
ncbi:HAD hydrolase family protein [Bacillus paralicheniformis]|uniref:HAD hydrolase family protein n=1 Tax=Bacillus paralicheniformis TaxID=1648923 RepID=UPI0022448430|nr:HAD hydrolase family protein [Bacillus paralicheniformis]UZN54734.1 HAD hydrolase family protein [Bacillus paralicheniformis]